MPITEDTYALYLHEGGVMPSPLLAYLPAEHARPSLFALRDRVLAHPGVREVSDVLPPRDQTHGSFQFALGNGDSALDFELALEYQEIGRAGEPEAPPTAHWCIYVGTYLGEGVLTDFHAQVKLLHFLAPDAIFVHDYAAVRTHPGSWLREVARSNVPPAPDTLYSIHVLQSPDGDGTTWLHSHGLRRCGSIEVEMVGVPADKTQAFATLFHTTAALWIEHGPPDPGAPFEVGQDMSLMWLPWEEAILDLAPDSLGTSSDRDEHHDGPSGVLFVPHIHPRTGGVSPRPITSVLPQLEDEPMLFLTHMETQRMTLLAKNRFPQFRDVYRRFGKNEDWFFQVKMGYQVDDCPDDADENEHLWFDVRGIRNGQVSATLLNEPYNIARMREGDTDFHPMDQLSDWCIDSPFGHFDANSIGHLEDLLRDSQT